MGVKIIVTFELANEKWPYKDFFQKPLNIGLDLKENFIFFHILMKPIKRNNQKLEDLNF